MSYKIKPVVLVLALMAANAGVCRASTEFRWLGAAGSVRNRDGINIAAHQATIITFISTNTTVDTIASAGQVVLERLVGDDWFYRAQPNQLAGLYFTPFMQEPGTELVGLYAYAVVLDRPFSQFTTFEAIPRDGTVYAAVSQMGWMGTGPNPSPIWDTIPSPSQSFTGGSVMTTLAVVPEPSVAGLMALGAGAMALRRRRERKLKLNQSNTKAVVDA